MLTKTRTIIITLIAAGSFATATVAPAVSQAQDNSAQGAAECEVLRLTYGLWMEAAHNSGEAKQFDLMDHYIAEAAATRLAGKDKDCDWSRQIERQPQSNRPPVAEVIKTAPSTGSGKETKAPVAKVITTTPVTTTPPVVLTLVRPTISVR